MRYPAARLALQAAGALDVLEIALDPLDAFLNDAPVGLDLRLAPVRRGSRSRRAAAPDGSRSGRAGSSASSDARARPAARLRVCGPARRRFPGSAPCGRAPWRPRPFRGCAAAPARAGGRRPRAPPPRSGPRGRSPPPCRCRTASPAEARIRARSRIRRRRGRSPGRGRPPPRASPRACAAPCPPAECRFVWLRARSRACARRSATSTRRVGAAPSRHPRAGLRIRLRLRACCSTTSPRRPASGAPVPVSAVPEREHGVSGIWCWRAANASPLARPQPEKAPTAAPDRRQVAGTDRKITGGPGRTPRTVREPTTGRVPGRGAARVSDHASSAGSKS